MNTQYAAYQKVERTILSDRRVQARILRHAAYILTNSKNTEEFNIALRYNLQFWTLIQADCLEETCMLPKELQANLLSLSIYMDKNTFKLMIDPTLDSIIDSIVLINNNVAKGLEE